MFTARYDSNRSIPFLFMWTFSYHQHSNHNPLPSPYHLTCNIIVIYGKCKEVNNNIKNLSYVRNIAAHNVTWLTEWCTVYWYQLQHDWSVYCVLVSVATWLVSVLCVGISCNMTGQCTVCWYQLQHDWSVYCVLVSVATWLTSVLCIGISCNMTDQCTVYCYACALNVCYFPVIWTTTFTQVCLCVCTQMHRPSTVSYEAICVALLQQNLE